jgi:hypothetical protein
VCFLIEAVWLSKKVVWESKRVVWQPGELLTASWREWRGTGAVGMDVDGVVSDVGEERGRAVRRGSRRSPGRGGAPLRLCPSPPDRIEHFDDWVHGGHARFRGENRSLRREDPRRMREGDS